MSNTKNKNNLVTFEDKNNKVIITRCSASLSTYYLELFTFRIVSLKNDKYYVEYMLAYHQDDTWSLDRIQTENGYLLDHYFIIGLSNKIKYFEWIWSYFANNAKDLNMINNEFYLELLSYCNEVRKQTKYL
jgi:hypothetical protein